MAEETNNNQPPVNPTPPSPTNTDAGNEKVYGVLAYIGILFLVPLY